MKKKIINTQAYINRYFLNIYLWKSKKIYSLKLIYI